MLTHTYFYDPTFFMWGTVFCGCVTALLIIFRHPLRQLKGRFFQAGLTLCTGLIGILAAVVWVTMVASRGHPQLALTAEDVICHTWPEPLKWTDITDVALQRSGRRSQSVMFGLNSRPDPAFDRVISRDGRVYCRVGNLDAPSETIFWQVQTAWNVAHSPASVTH